MRSRNARVTSTDDSSPGRSARQAGGGSAEDVVIHAGVRTCSASAITPPRICGTAKRSCSTAGPRRELPRGSARGDDVSTQHVVQLRRMRGRRDIVGGNLVIDATWVRIGQLRRIVIEFLVGQREPRQPAPGARPRRARWQPILVLSKPVRCVQPIGRRRFHCGGRGAIGPPRRVVPVVGQ